MIQRGKCFLVQHVLESKNAKPNCAKQTPLSFRREKGRNYWSLFPTTHTIMVKFPEPNGLFRNCVTKLTTAKVTVAFKCAENTQPMFIVPAETNQRLCYVDRPFSPRVVRQNAAVQNRCHATCSDAMPDEEV